MYKEMFLSLVLAVLLLFSNSSALSLPFFFGLSSELRALMSSLEKSSANQLLSLLKYHDLQQICRYNDQPNTNLTGIAIGSLLDDVWDSSRDLLALSLPSIFRNITIDGDWKEAAMRIHSLENCPAVGRYARFAGLARWPGPATNAPTEL
jgi:hypothetical protein